LYLWWKVLYPPERAGVSGPRATPTLAEVPPWRFNDPGTRPECAVSLKLNVLVRLGGIPCRVVAWERYWKADNALAAVRDAAALDQLSEEQRQVRRELWSRLDALLARATSEPH
jgi:hypothetical protein